MNRALSTAATGLQAQQANIERISSDLSNVNTDGYKRSHTEFQDLMYETIKKAGDQLGANSQAPVGIQKGMGVKVGSTYKIFEQGPTRMTYRPYDLLIEGNGFFTIQTASGDTAYSRVGSFKRDAQGRLTLGNGSLLVPQITIPSNASDVKISGDGEVVAQMPNNEEIVLGQIQLTTFQNPQGLSAVGAGVFAQTPASGAPIQGVPGENGMGLIQQGALEGSNVNVATSMVDMISTQRAYEMGTKVMGVVDQMMQATSSIK